MTGESSARLFIALPVPVAAATALMKLPRKGIDARWNFEGDLHITLRFLGECSRAKQIQAQEALHRVRRPAFYVDVNGLGLFLNEKQSILHAAIESTRKLTTLCAEVTDCLTPLGFDFGQRPFVPHVTLARLNRRNGLDDYIARHGQQVRAHWQATSFGLMRSGAPDAGGRRYTLLENYPLDP